MKQLTFFVCLAVLILLIPAGVSASTNLFIYSTPPGAEIYLNDSYIGRETPRELYAVPGAYTVMLRKAGFPDYTTLITITGGSTVTVDYDFPNAAPGKSSASPVISSINPSSGATDTVVSITSLAGTNFASRAFFNLQKSGSSPISGSVTSVNSAGTKITGTIDLKDQVPGNYQVCVYNNAFIYSCDLTFTITGTDAESGKAGTNSSIYFDTSPSGATVYLDTIRAGTSGFTYYDATPGTYNVLIRKTGYNDYSGSVTAVRGKRVTFSVELTPLGEDTTGGSPGTTSEAVTPVKTVTTVRKSPVKVPTSWPSATTTEASPVDPVMIIGTICIGFIALKKQ